MGEDLLLGLVVKDFAFVLVAVVSLELSADSVVS
jgi:hypothetical protein